MQKSKYIGYEKNQSPFYCLNTKKKLASLLYITDKKLIRIAAQSKTLYLEREVITRSGKVRSIEEPNYQLKRIQKRIEELLKRIKIPDYIHSPGRGKSYITNASVHTNVFAVRSIDIAEYFHSTSEKYIYDFFCRSMRCSSDVAQILADLLTFNNYLPTGSPCSPILSYFSHEEMWSSIYEIVKDSGCNITVYMDDITISGNCISDKLVWEIDKKLRHHNLRINYNKSKHYINKKNCEITGVIISGSELKLPNRQHLKINRVTANLNKPGINDDVRRHQLMQLQGLNAQKDQVEKIINF
jgi:hypothetical protein